MLGERSGLTDDSTTGESRDRRDLGLLGRQQELLEAVVATGTPVVLVVVSGRPLAIEWAAEPLRRRSSWPGSRATPGPKRSPRSSPATSTRAASCRSRCRATSARSRSPIATTRPAASRAGRATTSTDRRAALAVRASAGRTRPSAIDGLASTRAAATTGGDGRRSSVDVTNTGERAGDEVVQLYVRDVEARRPPGQGAARLPTASTWQPGECRTVAFRLSAEQFAYYGVDHRRVVEPGAVRLFVGRSSADLPLVADVALVGPVFELVDRRDYVTPTAIE